MRKVFIMFKAKCLLLSLVITSMYADAYAAEHTVSQADKKFEIKEISIAKGDTVNFVNNDKVAHNIYSKTPEHKFEVKVQKPGDGNKVVFNTPGKADVRCLIHPKMKLIINISE